MDATQRVICVTGATSGIGKATAQRFAREGWKVIAVGRRRERLEALAQELGDICLPLPLDVSDRNAVADAFASLPDGFKPIDVLVNNAGGALGLEGAVKASLDDWETMVDANIKGVLYCTKAVIGEMAQRGSGHVINISSIASFNAYPGANVYGATKAFVSQFSRNLRADMHGTGVRVSVIEPGMLQSEFSTVRFKGDKNRADSLYSGAEPLVPEDIADLTAYVVSVPPNVDIYQVRVTPTSQSDGGMRIYRKDS